MEECKARCEEVSCLQEAVCKAWSEDEPSEEVMDEWKELFAKHGLKMSLQKK